VKNVIWKIFGGIDRGPFKVSLQYLSEELRKTAKTEFRITGPRGRDSNQVPLKYESVVITSRPRHWLMIMFIIWNLRHLVSGNV